MKLCLNYRSLNSDEQKKNNSDAKRKIDPLVLTATNTKSPQTISSSSLVVSKHHDLDQHKMEGEENTALLPRSALMTSKPPPAMTSEAERRSRSQSLRFKRHRDSRSSSHLGSYKRYLLLFNYLLLPLP